MVAPEKLIESTREAFAMFGLPVMAQGDLINHEGEVVSVVAVTTEYGSPEYVAILHESLSPDTMAGEIVESVVEIAEKRGIL